ncbi:MAG TPA: PrpF domain-containing protein [Nakamurella sp.]|nr:PrpF domain-containing protein [Nakamurella sp.]
MTDRTMLDGEMLSVPAMIIRGGTSKGVFLRGRDLPDDTSLWGPYLIDMFGARDVRQIDGIGGAVPTTSKCCIVESSTRDDTDVDYTFAQVGIGEERVYWDFNCGNLTPAVGTFAILAGLVEPRPGMTTVRIYQTNTKIPIDVTVPTTGDGSPLVAGDYRIAGVSNTGAAVMTDFSRATGASLGRGLFPTGRRTDRLTIPGLGEVRCTIVDLANMCVFFRAEDTGMTGTEMPERGPELVGTFTAIRRAAQDLLGVDPSKTTPWPVAVGAPRPFSLYGSGRTLGAEECDFTVRFAGIQPMRDTMHEAFPGTASACTAVAAVTAGTVVNTVYAALPHTDDTVRLAHPSGVSVVHAAVSDGAADGDDVLDRCTVDHVRMGRTVRPIMRGEVLVRRDEVERLCDALRTADPTRSGVPTAMKETQRHTAASAF